MAPAKKDKKSKKNGKTEQEEEQQEVNEEELKKNAEEIGEGGQIVAEQAQPEDFTGANSDQTEVLSSRQRSFLTIILKQLYNNGMDLTKVTCIVDFLEPRSLLEKLTDVLVHQHLLTTGFAQQEEKDRLFYYVLWYLSSWHLKPKGVRKPYNPVLGEIYRCYYDLDDGSRTVFFAEQVEHHPPVSAVYGENKKHQVSFCGWYYPKSTWSGNSAGVVPKGALKVYLKKFGQTITLNWPNIYARGLLFGKAMYEIAGKVSMTIQKSEKDVENVKSPEETSEDKDYSENEENDEEKEESEKETTKEHKLSAQIEFKAKPWFGGEYNNISAHLKDGNKEFKTLSGKWTDKIYVKSEDKKSDKKSKGDLVLDCSTEKSVPKKILPESMWLPNESQIIWKDLTSNLKKNDLDAASKAKHLVEEQKRKEEKERKEQGIEYQPKFFKKAEKDFYEFIGHEMPEFSILFTHQ